MNNPHQGREYWRGILAQYASSNQKVTDFCRQNQLSSRRFYKWRLRLSKELPATEARGLSGLPLLPVSMEGPLPESGSGQNDSGVSLSAGGLTIRLARDFDGVTLRRVLDIAGGRPC